MVEAAQTKLISALRFLTWGWSIIPLCWPNDQGHCGCGRNHAGAGKAPLTTRGVNDSSDQFDAVMQWWARWPLANIGIDLGKSGLFVIGPDSVEWEDRFQQQGLPETLTAKSGGGEGHYHYYYRKPVDTPQTRLNRSNEYDIQTQGYMVAPPSLHQSGNHYAWLDPEMAEKHIRGTESLAEPPQWAVTLLKERGTETKPRRQEPTWDALPPPPVINATTLDPASYKWWTGQATKMAGKNVDRSTTLFRLGSILAKRGYDESTIVAALHERDIALGYNKFSRRADGGIRAYTDIATKVMVDERGRVNKTNRPRPPGPPPLPDQYDDEGNPIDPKGDIPPTGPANDIAISRVAEYFQHVTRARHWQSDDMRRKLFITKTGEPNKYLASHILFENPHLYPDQADHVSWLKYADGEWAKENPFMGQGLRINPKVMLAERCLKPGWKWCDIH